MKTLAPIAVSLLLVSPALAQERPWQQVSDPTAAQQRTVAAAGVRLVPAHRDRARPGPSRALPGDPQLVQQQRQHR